ncbi:T9SS type A sorting domain-containing protein [Hyphobacterium sp. CCMP332]|nr:T9SS type A sorting domain-containing protein [Hyphobacterium sp. CCMP332]
MKTTIIKSLILLITFTLYYINSVAQTKTIIGYYSSVFSENYFYSLDTDGSNFQKLFNTNQSFNLYENPIWLNGKYWGMARGGDSNEGVLFSYKPGDQFSKKVISFKDQIGTAFFRGPRLLQIGGEIWGATTSGGQNGSGTLFSVDTFTKQLTIHHHFTNTRNMRDGDMTVYNGKIYLLSIDGGQNGLGQINEFEINTNNFTTVLNFGPSIPGRIPYGNLLLDGDKLWFATKGDLNNPGTISYYDLLLDSSNVVHSFTSLNGLNPSSNMLKIGSNLFGTCKDGGQFGYGSVFKFSLSNNSLNVIHHFDSSGHNRPEYDIAYRNGFIYGSTSPDWSFDGFVYSLDTLGNSFQILDSIENSESGLSLINDELYYSEIKIGNCSDFMKIDNNIQIDTAHKFHNYYGQRNFQGLLQIGSELIFATTENGKGNNGCLCKTDTGFSNIEILYCPESNNIPSNLNDNIGANGDYIYGSTTIGGSFNKGYIFRYSMNDESIQIIKHLDSNTGIFLSAPNFHGQKIYFNSWYGALNNHGAIIEIDTTNWNTSILHSFNLPNNQTVYQMKLINNSIFGIASSFSSSSLIEFDLGTNNLQTNHNYAGNNISPFITVINNSIFGLNGSGGTNSNGIRYSIDKTGNSYLESSEMFNYGLRTSLTYQEAYFDGKIWSFADDMNSAARPALYSFDPFIPNISVIYTFPENPFELSKILIVNGSVSSISDESKIENSLVIYPNPVINTLNFTLPKNETPIRLRIIDLSGKEIMNTNLNSLSLNTSSLQTGLFIGILESTNQTYSFKFIKD